MSDDAESFLGITRGGQNGVDPSLPFEPVIVLFLMVFGWPVLVLLAKANPPKPECSRVGCHEPGRYYPYKCERCGESFNVYLCKDHATWKVAHPHPCNLIRATQHN